MMLKNCDESQLVILPYVFYVCGFSSNLYVFFIGKKAEGNEDDIPSSAVDLQVKERVCISFRMNDAFINHSEIVVLFI